MTGKQDTSFWASGIFLLAIFLLLPTAMLNAQTINGSITDSQNLPVPYATIYVRETQEGTTSNIDGLFHLQLPPGNYHLTIRSMGYLQQNLEVQLDRDSIFLPVVMRLQEFELKEIKIFPGKEDPAYFIMRKAMAKAPFYRDKIRHYTADLYIKSNFEFQNIPRLIQQREMDDGRKFKDYFKENVTYVIESHNKITYDYPSNYDQKVISKRTSLVGIEEPPVMGLMTESFYNERPADVISPLSPLALRHYDFRYEGFITVGEFDVFKIGVQPKRKSDELVEGYIYIVDGLWCIYNLDLSSSIKFVDYRIKQQFENLGNGNWLPVAHHINGNFNALGMRGTFYYGASVKYDSIVDNSPKVIPEEKIKTETVQTKVEAPAEINEKLKELRQEVTAITRKEELSNSDVRKVNRLNRQIAKEEYMELESEAGAVFQQYKIEDKKTSAAREEVWDSVRTIPLTPAEVESYKIADSMRGLQTMQRDSTGKVISRPRRFISALLLGKYDICPDSAIGLRYTGLLDPENYAYNAVDGYKFRQYLRLKVDLDSGRQLWADGELGYAFNRQAMFGKLTFSMINVLGKDTRLGLSAGKESRDFKSQVPGITPLVNTVSSFVFAENFMRLYETGSVQVDFSKRLNRRITVLGNVAYNDFHRLENSASFPFNENRDFAPNLPHGFDAESRFLADQKSFSWSAGASYRKRLRKPWMQQSPYLFLSDYYRFDLNFHQGVKGIFSSASDFSYVDFLFRQQANLSISTGIDWSVNAGYFFNNEQLHFSQFKHFASARTPVSLRSFSGVLQTINDYEPGTRESYLAGSFELRSEYLLLRYLSFFNKKTWSESLHLNYLTTPTLKNYWEAGYSINNVFFVGNLGVFAGFRGGEFDVVSIKFSLSLTD